MSEADKKVYEFDAAHPGESLDSYLKRHKAHPDQSDKRSATDADVAAVDKTETYKDQGFTITKK